MPGVLPSVTLSCDAPHPRPWMETVAQNRSEGLSVRYEQTCMRIVRERKLRGAGCRSNLPPRHIFGDGIF